MTAPPNVPVVKTGPAKAWVAGIGTTLTATTTALAVVSLAVGDDAIDVSEIGAIVTALATWITTVWAVWRVPNPRVS